MVEKLERVVWEMSIVEGLEKPQYLAVCCIVLRQQYG